MIQNLFNSVSSLFKSIIIGALLVAAAAGAVTIAYFVVMTCWRVIGSTWAHLFSKPWP